LISSNFLAIDRPMVQLREHALVARAMKNALNGLVERKELRFYVEFPDNKEDLTVINKEIILRLDDPVTGIQSDSIHIHLIDICFIEIIHNWFVFQKRFFIFFLNKQNILGYIVKMYLTQKIISPQRKNQF
jgi:hypothetical protein